jgi:2-polyprenyl-6-methoxyphenol hydroxylase-like FAD-dependent oxidoreductase
VLILGDAAHTSTPHLGQGAGIAIEDAVVLRDELAKPRPVEGTLRAFVERRFERCRYITALSAQVGDWEIEQSHHGERMAALSESAAFMAQPI